MFERLAQSQFHVKRIKCELFLPKVEFLGHQVSADGVQVMQGKVDAIVKWQTPTCIRDVQSFLGLCNYYRRFIKSLAKIAMLLTNLTRKSKEFYWDSACEQACQTLKTKLTNTHILQMYDPESRHQVWVDASDFAVGATLVQWNSVSNMFLPVEYMSHRLNSVEYNYSATEREFFAIISGLKR